MARKRPLRLDDLFALKVVGKIAISPDGARIAFELKRADASQNKNYTQLMIADAAGGAVRALTKARKHNDTLPKWSPTGKELGFLSDRDKRTRLWMLPMDGGEPRPLTDRDGTVHDFNWSPDGKRLVFTVQKLTERQKLERDGKGDRVQKKPTYKHITRLTHKLDGVGFWNGHYTHVHLIGAARGNAKPLTRGPYDHREPRFNPSGKLVSFISNRTEDPDRNYDQSDIFVVKPAGGAARRITKGPGGCQGHSWSPDGKTIAFVGAPNRPGQWWKYDEHVHLVDAAGGKPRKLVREIDNLHFNDTLGDVTIAPFETFPPTWSPDGKRVYFLVTEHGATRLYSRSVRRADTRCEVGGNVNVMYYDSAADGQTFAMSIGTATNPGDVFVWKVGDQRPRQLSHVNDDVLKRVAVVEPEEFWLRSGNTKLQCWVIKPPGFRASRKYPAILEIHGGPQAQYGYAFFHEMQYFAAKGYVVAYCNPRGSAGYGCDFRKCIVGDWGNLDHKDVKKLGDWLFSRRYVDRKRVGVTGGSYGGYMTNWIVGHEKRYRAAVTQRSVVTWDSFFGTSDFGQVLVHEIGGLPWKGREKLTRTSPFTHVEKMTTPLLIIHSEQDLRCSIEQAEQLYVALKYLGRDVEYVAFEGEPHGLSRSGRPQNRAERLRRIIGWFDRKMK